MSYIQFFLLFHNGEEAHPPCFKNDDELQKN